MLKAFVCNSCILFVLILFKYVFLYLGKRYLCQAFACFASYSLYFYFISLVLFYFYAWFQVMLLVFVYHSYILLVLILFKYVLLYLGKRYLCHAFACFASYSLYLVIKASSTTLTLDQKYVTQGRVRITYTMYWTKEIVRT